MIPLPNTESPDVDERVSGGASAGLLRDDDRHGRRAAEPGAALAGRTGATVKTRRNGQPSKRARKEERLQFPANRERLAAVFALFVPRSSLIPRCLRPSSANSETHQGLKTATSRRVSYMILITSRVLIIWANTLLLYTNNAMFCFARV